MKIRLKNPPINELIIGVYFDPPLISLRSEHIGLLWSRFRSEFPKVEQREPLLVNIQGSGPSVYSGGEFPFMPRFWFISEDEINLVQVQKDAFLLNWRKREAEYPNFDEKLKSSFSEKFSIFKEFINRDVGVYEVKIGLCELTYVDVIEPCEYWQGPQDTYKVVPSFSVPKIGPKSGELSAFNCTYSHDISPHLQLHIAIRVAKSNQIPNSSCLILEFKALGQPNGSEELSIDQWYEQAHNAIISQFLNVTDKHVQRKFWMLEEETE